MTEHKIDTGSARPVRLPPYRLPHAYREDVQQELQEMLEQGIIEPVNGPFGLQGAPATFQCMMDRLIQGFEEFTSAYLDDLLIYSLTWEEHIEHIRQVFQRLKEAGLTAKPRKCQFAMQ